MLSRLSTGSVGSRFFKSGVSTFIAFSLSSLGYNDWPSTHSGRPVAASQVVELQMGATVPSSEPSAC